LAYSRFRVVHSGLLMTLYDIVFMEQST